MVLRWAGLRVLQKAVTRCVAVVGGDALCVLLCCHVWLVLFSYRAGLLPCQAVFRPSIRFF